MAAGLTPELFLGRNKVSRVQQSENKCIVRIRSRMVQGRELSTKTFTLYTSFWWLLVG